MTEPVMVTAGWALAGKIPGASDDYSVLASSAKPFSRAEFTVILAEFTAGTPSTRETGSAALPWVTVSWVGTGPDLNLGIAIQDATDKVDSAGRPIIETSYFCVPYAELRESPVSYTDLYEAVSQVRLPLPGDEPLRLTLPRFSPAGAAARVTDFGEEAVATTSSLLFCGPVNIVQAEASTLPERLRYLDAVASLLPYGYRAHYTAGTWSESGSRHRLRLAFAARPREDASPVPWRGTIRLRTSDAAAAAYLAQLDEIRGRSPGRLQTYTLPDLVAYLATDAEPRKFEQVQPAITRLRDIDLPFVVLNAVRAGTAERAGVRRVFELARVTELDPDDQRVMLGELISYGEREDWPAIQRWWGLIAGDTPNLMLPALISTARRLLWTAAPSLLVRDLRTLASSHSPDHTFSYGLNDTFLAGLMPRPADPLDLTGGASTAAQLVIDGILVGSAVDAHPQTQTALAQNPLVVCELMRALADSPQEAALAIRWLTPVTPDMIRPFAEVLSDPPAAINQRAVARLYDSGIACVRALLMAAFHARRLDLALPGFLTWLVSQSQIVPEAQAYWRSLAWALDSENISCQAWVDLVLLAVGESPRYLLAVAGKAGWQEYGESFAEAWTGLLSSRPAKRDRLTATLTEYLDHEPWADDADRALSVIDLSRRLSQAGQQPTLLAVVAATLSATPTAVGSHRVNEWLAQAERQWPGIIRSGALLSLRTAPPGSPAEKIATLCVRAYHAQVAPDDVGTALEQSQTVGSGVFAIDLMEELRRQLKASGADLDAVQKWFECLALLIAGGKFGQNVADGFRATALRSAVDEIWHQVDLAFIAAYGAGRGKPNVPEDLRLSLQRAQDAIAKLLKASKKHAWSVRAAADPVQDAPSDDQPQRETS
jgi:hypothetical protein